VQSTGIFDARAIETLIRDHEERRINVGYQLWGLLTLFLWIRKWRVETRPAQEMARRKQAGALVGTTGL
jgi:asparagine synthase (glutamine-hydrolysing)